METCMVVLESEVFLKVRVIAPFGDCLEVKAMELQGKVPFTFEGSTTVNPPEQPKMKFTPGTSWEVQFQVAGPPELADEGPENDRIGNGDVATDKVMSLLAEL